MAVRSLSKELLLKATEKLNENPDKNKQYLKELLEWIATVPNIKVRQDDQWLLSYLRGCKFDLDLVKEKLESLFCTKTVSSEYYSRRNPFTPEIQGLLKLGICLPLQNATDPSEPLIILFRSGVLDPENMLLDDAIKLALMVLEILLMENDNFVVSGCHLIIDNANMASSLNLLLPITAKKVYKILKNCYALQSKGAYVFNVAPTAKVMYNMFLMNSKLKKEVVESVHIYEEGNTNQLYNAVPLASFPMEYGGKGQSVKELTELWKRKVESYKNWFLEDDNRAGAIEDCKLSDKGVEKASLKKLTDMLD